MTVQNVEELNLNDSCVLGISIQSGEMCFKVDYIEDYDSCASRVYLLAFKGCHTVSSAINLNVTWPDSILCGTETRDGELRNIKIEMATSASVFNISCRSVELIPLN